MNNLRFKLYLGVPAPVAAEAQAPLQRLDVEDGVTEDLHLHHHIIAPAFLLLTVTLGSLWLVEVLVCCRKISNASFTLDDEKILKTSR